MHIIDLHCDTLTELLERGCSLCGNDLHFDLDRLPDGYGWCQTFAAFMPDTLRGKAAVEYFEKLHAVFAGCMERFPQRIGHAFSADDIERLWQEGKTAALFSVEGGSALGGELANIERLRRRGIRFLTLTWNGENELAGGIGAGTGLTGFGRAAVPLLEEAGIIIDVSHLSDAGFRELESIARRPYAATHSCSRAVYGHRRNLTDRQFAAIVQRGGLVGLNFCTAFLCASGELTPEERENEVPCLPEERVPPAALTAHILHFLELGGEDVLALGSDFDGCTVPYFLRGTRQLPKLEEILREAGLDSGLIEKIFWKNALDFLRRYDKTPV